MVCACVLLFPVHGIVCRCSQVRPNKTSWSAVNTPANPEKPGDYWKESAKQWKIDELKIKMKKSKELGKKNEGEKYKMK